MNLPSVEGASQDQSQETTESITDHRSWVVRIHYDREEIFGLPAICFKMLCALESFWRDKTSCFPSTETLADLCGCGLTKAKETLDQLEDRGWIRRQTTRRENKCRRHIFALKRLDRERPVADAIDSAVDEAKVGRATFGKGRTSDLEERPSVLKKDTWKKNNIVVENPSSSHAQEPTTGSLCLGYAPSRKWRSRHNSPLLT